MGPFIHRVEPGAGLMRERNTTMQKVWMGFATTARSATADDRDSPAMVGTSVTIAA